MLNPSLPGNHKLAAFVATSDPDRAQAFYGGTLGLRLVSRDDFAVVFDARGTTLRVTIVKQVHPAPHTVLGWEVPDIAATVEALETAGVALKRYGLPNQDGKGIWTAPGGARIAWFEDPDGNVLSVAQVG